MRFSVSNSCLFAKFCASAVVMNDTETTEWKNEIKNECHNSSNKVPSYITHYNCVGISWLFNIRCCQYSTFGKLHPNVTETNLTMTYHEHDTVNSSASNDPTLSWPLQHLTDHPHSFLH